MPQRLQLTRNCQFYKPTVKITKTLIEGILAEAAKNKPSKYELKIVRKNSQDQGFDYTYSVIVFRTERPVYFMDDPSLKDTIYAYLVILEISGYICILKKSCASIEEIINKKMDLINFDTLIGTFNDHTTYQKLSTRSMTMSGQAIRSKTLEAENLDGAMSTHAAGRTIPHYVKINNDGVHQSINLSSGRINELSSRSPINELALWAQAQVSKFNNPTTSSFLNNFAKPVSFDVIKNLNPFSLLVEVSDLDDLLLDEDVEWFFIRENNEKLKVTTKMKNTFIKVLSKVYEIETSLSLNGINFETLKVNNKTITFESKFLRKLVFNIKGVEQNLQQIILKRKAFSVCFKDFSFMYSRGKGYQDSSGISQIDSLLKIFKDKSELSSVTSEKGSLRKADIEFEASSIFKQVENIHSKADFILCDDLGIEWADHLIFDISDKEIIFIHSKYGDKSNSASKLHDVVGQAIKNLGYMWFSIDQIDKKVNDKLCRTYNGNKIQSSIPRFRKGLRCDLNSKVSHLMNDYRTIRKCIICCSFLSKSNVENEFLKLKSGQNVRGNIPQLFWIISSFIHAAKEQNVMPEIYCQP